MGDCSEDALRALFAEGFDAASPPEPVREDGPVAVALTYNEMRRLPHFLAHHRALGVRRFLIVDNASTDGSGAYLDAQPDVTRLPSAAPYKDWKARWRWIVADLLLDGRWALFPDVDEFFVAPGWPDAPFATALAHWERTGAEAVQATMVDMYGEAPLTAAAQAPADAPLLELCPFFDADGYRMIPTSARMAHPTPPYSVFGGPRERLLAPPPPRAPTAVDRWLLDRVFSPRRPPASGGLDRGVRRMIWRAVRRATPPKPGEMGKVPLIRWRRGLRFTGGVHRIDAPLRLAEDRGALLHFKFLDDFADRTRQNVARAQHANGARAYRVYAGRMEALGAASAIAPCSVRLRDWRDLEAAGLMRATPALRAALAEWEPSA